MVSPAVIWPDYCTEVLQKLVADRAGSAKQIAAMMTKQFEVPFTRNMICGKIARLKLSTADPNAPPKSKPKRERKPSIFKPAAQPKPQACDIALRCVEIEPLNITLFELTDKTCKWPYGDNGPPYTFCGHPSFEGSYCVGHGYLSRAA